MARMFNPPHPGLTLRDDVLPALGLSVTEAAQQLDVNRGTLSRVLNGRAAISPEMALRIEAWLGVKRGGDARLWLAEQSAYAMWQAEQRLKAAPTIDRNSLVTTGRNTTEHCAFDARVYELGLERPDHATSDR